MHEINIFYVLFQNQLFIWCCVFVVVSLSQLSVFWPKNTTPTRWFAANATLGSILVPPIAARSPVDIPPTSGPKRSWSKLYCQDPFHDTEEINENYDNFKWLEFSTLFSEWRRIVQQFISRDFKTQFFKMKKRDDDFLFFWSRCKLQFWQFKNLLL